MASAEILAKLGLNTESFTAGLDRARNSVAKFSTDSEKQVKTVARAVGTLRQLFMLGGLLAVARGFFQSAIEHSRNYTGALDENVEATRRFDAAMQNLSVGAAQVGVNVIGWVEKASIGLASLIFGTEAAADALDRLNAEAAARAQAQPNEQNQRAADDLAKLRRNIAFNDADGYGKLAILINEIVDLKQKQRGLDAQSTEFLKLQAALEEKTVARKKVIADLDKGDVEKLRMAQEVEEAFERIADFEEERARASMTSGQKIKSLEADRARISAQIAKHEATIASGAEVSVKLLESLLALKREQLTLEERIADARDSAKGESKVNSAVSEFFAPLDKQSSEGHMISPTEMLKRKWEAFDEAIKQRNGAIQAGVDARNVRLATGSQYDVRAAIQLPGSMDKPAEKDGDLAALGGKLDTISGTLETISGYLEAVSISNLKTGGSSK